MYNVYVHLPDEEKRKVLEVMHIVLCCLIRKDVRFESFVYFDLQASLLLRQQYSPCKLTVNRNSHRNHLVMITK